MQATDQGVTYAELLQWPDDGRQRELHDGEVVVVPAPTFRHQRVALNVVGVLRQYEAQTGGAIVMAPFDIVLSTNTVLQPDVVFFRPERAHLLDEWGPARTAPDLAVEVLSPRTAVHDRGRKMLLLARFGVPEYWIVDPARNTIEICVLRGAAYQLVLTADGSGPIESPTLAGLVLSTAQIFAP